MNTQLITLPDGRKLAYSEYGDPAGIPVLLFHGSPGSRVWGRENDSLLKKYGLRGIAPERPGFGLSSYMPGRRIADWVNDVERLVAHLRLDEFQLAGFSGGGPYALACAARFPGRVGTVTLISGLAPADTEGFTDGMSAATRKSFFLFRKLPPVSRLLDMLAAYLIKNRPEKFINGFQKQLCRWDRELIDNMIAEGRAQPFIRHIQEAYRQGVKAARHDAALLIGEWRLDLDRIRQKILVWHGEADMLMPIRPVRTFVRQFDHCECHFIPEAGHLLLNDDKIADRIFSAIAG